MRHGRSLLLLLSVVFALAAGESVLAQECEMPPPPPPQAPNA